MFKRLCKGMLGIALAMLAAMPATTLAESTTSAAVQEYLAQGDEPGAVQVAQATEAPSASMAVAQTTTGSTNEPVKTDGNIEMTFKEPEQDILTRAAMEKLNADIGSLTFKNTELADVIRFIGRKLDLNFIFDADAVQGKVTLTFRNVRVKDALDSILTAQKLALVPDKSGIFRIVPQNRVGQKEVETRTEVVQLNWVPAADVQTTMKPFLSQDGRMEINEMRNVVIITDVPPNLENIKELITKVDLPERQVMIEARLVDINTGALRNLAVDISASRLNDARDWQSGSVVQTGVDQTGNPQLGAATIPFTDVLGVVNNLLEGASVKKGKGTIALGDTISFLGNNYNLNAVFTALEQRNIVQVLANPRVSTLNNVEADIKIVQQIPFISASNLVQGAGTSQQIEFKEAGVDIKVRPIITPNGYVRMEIMLQQKIFRGRVGSAALDPPLIDERNAATNVIVSGGETAVLGGLRQLQNNESVDGVPWLHRAPIFGWLFKNKNYDQRKTELVLMMTPRIVEKTLPMTEHEHYLYNDIDRQWHIPERYMDDVANVDDESVLHHEEKALSGK